LIGIKKYLRPIGAIISLIIMFTLMFSPPVNRIISVLEFLRDANLVGRSYNIVGVVWFGLTFLIMAYHYFSTHRGDMIKSVLFGFASTIFIHLVSDEVNFFMYAFSRVNIVDALRLYITITDKYYRWFILIPTVAYVMVKAYDFKYYWNQQGFFIILMVTTIYGFVSIFLGWYGWGYADPLNIQKYVCTYLLYYVVFVILVYVYYPKRD